MPIPGEYGWVDEKQNPHYQLIYDLAPQINANNERKADGSNGFTKERTMRHIASFEGPGACAAYHAWAKRVGYYQMDRHQKRMAMYKFLSDHPEFCVVDKLKHDTANQGNLIIK